MALATYYPEMNQAKPAADFEASASYSGGFRVKTKRTLKGRGITFRMTYTAADLTPQAQDKVGWNEYQLTRAAFDKLIAAEAVSMETLL